MSPVLIRRIDPASDHEIALVAARMRETLIEVEGPEVGGNMYSMEWLIDRVRWHLDPRKSNAAVFLATDGEQQIVGHTIVRVEKDDNEAPFGLFSTTYVVPAQRRSGVATRLLAAGEHWMMGRRLPSSSTWTSSTNTKLIELYRRHGYEKTAEDVHASTGTLMVMLSKALPNAPPDEPPRAAWVRWYPPESPSRRGPVLAIHRPSEYHGTEQKEFSTWLDPKTLLVCALQGSGGQSTGSEAARLAQVTLATLFEAKDYGPRLGTPVEPTGHVFGDMEGWAAWLVDRRPLPKEPGALLEELGRRIGGVLEGANLRLCCLGADGVLAVIREGRATLLRRGVARVYRLRDGEIQTLVHEDVLGRDVALLGDPEAITAVAPHYWVPVSMFETIDRSGTRPPIEIDVRRGDRLIFAGDDELLRALADPAREQGLTLAVPDPTAELPPTEEMAWHGWGIVAVDIDEALAP